jgi:neutral ceramidase
LSGWQLSSDSPLLGLTDRGRAQFAVDPEPVRELAEVDGLLAGAAEVDITPPPGMPKAGYSSNATDGIGFRTRLRARVLHLRAGTSSLALVQCDLLGGSAVLQHLVAKSVAQSTDVDLNGLFIGATHTHAGPGQFLGTDFYNRFASNRPGFDPAWSHFLVEQIAGGVVEAVEQRQPARLATGCVPVWGWTRNRSLEPHVTNESVADKRTAAHRKFMAINPLLHLVRVDTSDGSPLAAMVLFSVHGTGISVAAREYNADVWAYVTGSLADHIERSHGTRPVVGAVQATHADVAPAIRPGAAGYLEARRVGCGIGEEASALWETLEPHLTEHVVLGAALDEVDLDSSSTIDGITLPRRPAVGAALVAGATENTTPVIHRIPPFRAGSPRRYRPDDEHGAKWVLGSRWLQPLILPSKRFPRVLPIQIIRIGHLAVVGMPFEVTVEAGRRIRAGVAAELEHSGVAEVTVSSVANEYCGYVTTAEEYELQHYEGGHTLYGPKTEGFLTAHAERLARQLASGRRVARGSRRTFDLHLHRYLPRPTGRATVGRHFLGAASFTDPRRHTDGFWALEWVDVAPGDLHWHEPLARVEERSTGGAWEPARRQRRVVDDGGWDLELTYQGERPGDKGHRYLLRWFDPELRGDREHRVLLAANAGQPETASEAFS